MSYPRPYEVKTTDPKLPEAQDTEPTEPGNPALRIYEDAEVWSADEQALGTVAEISEQHFRVGHTGPDYWIAQDRVAQSNEQRLTLDINEDEIRAYAFDKPPVVDEMLTTEERVRQRERMERELDEQRPGTRSRTSIDEKEGI